MLAASNTLASPFVAATVQATEFGSGKTFKLDKNTVFFAGWPDRLKVPNLKSAVVFPCVFHCHAIVDACAHFTELYLCNA